MFKTAALILAKSVSFRKQNGDGHKLGAGVRNGSHYSIGMDFNLQDGTSGDSCTTS